MQDEQVGCPILASISDCDNLLCSTSFKAIVTGVPEARAVLKFGNSSSVL
jgi:hypothetical protein